MFKRVLDVILAQEADCRLLQPQEPQRAETPTPPSSETPSSGVRTLANVASTTSSSAVLEPPETQRPQRNLKAPIRFIIWDSSDNADFVSLTEIQFLATLASTSSSSGVLQPHITSKSPDANSTIDKRTNVVSTSASSGQWKRPNTENDPEDILEDFGRLIEDEFYGRVPT